MVQKVRLSDVSAAAGLGIATVSRALADERHPDVSEATRKRVRSIAEELGYRPSAIARALRSGSYRSMSVVIPDDTWGWWELVVRGAFRAAADAGYQLLVHPVGGPDRGHADVIDSLANVPSEGVLVFGAAENAEAVASARRLKIPIVAVDDTAGTPLVPTVSVDNRAGAREAVTYLASLGRSRIAMVVAHESVYAKDRESGYREALEAAELGATAHVVTVTDPSDDGTTWPELDDLLRGATAIDALFCESDGIAATAIRSVRAAGLTVPDDIAVVGFDDERIALVTDPPLTTMRQPLAAMGARAVDMLLNAIDGETAEPSLVLLPAELVIRRSTSRAPVTPR